MNDNILEHFKFNLIYRVLKTSLKNKDKIFLKFDKKIKTYKYDEI